MNFKVTYALILCWFAAFNSAELSGQVLDPPQFNCIQVAANGDATLNWTPPSDPNGVFSYYEVYTSLFPGIPFTAVDQVVPLASANYTHVTTQTLTNDYYYFIQTWSSDGSGNYVSENSDTLRNIFLEAEPAGNNCQNCDSSAYLTWNSPFLNESIVPDGLEYEVWTDYPGNVWQLLVTLPFGVTNYLHIVENCVAETMNFQIRMTTPDGCQFISNIDGDEFSDNTHPITAIITGISVNSAGQGVIEWDPSISGDTDGYWVYECDGTNTILMDYVSGGSTDTYLDFFAQPYLGPLSYAIASMDVCGNTDTTICSTSMFLDVEEFIVCDDAVLMDWTGYGSWQDPVSYYVIYHTFSIDNSIVNDVFLPIDTVSGSSLSLAFADVNLEYGGYNAYQIEAVDTINDYHAFSNIAMTFVPSYEPPDYVYLATASVISSDSSMILVEMDPTAVAFSYTLQRFDESAFEWDDILTLNAMNQSSLTFYDSQLTSDVFSYTYRVVVENSCGQVIDTTNKGTTVLLSGLPNQDRLVNTIVWSAYSEWEDGIAAYRIHRKNGNDGVFEIIEEIGGGGTRSFEDDVSDFVGTTGEFCYMIEAVPFVSSTTGTGFSSFSNELCLSLDPVIWIPNCFIVEGFNRAFAPVISFADLDKYKMIIYSRWGDVIFETEDYNVPWDGTMNGKTVQEGTYTYFITVKDGNGRAHDRAGFVTMLVDKEK